MVLWAVVAVIVGLLSQGKDFALFAALALGLSDYRVWVIFLCSVVGIAVMLAAREMRSGRRVLKVNDIEDSRWLAHADIAKSDNMAITSYSKLGDVADGVPVYARRQGKDITVVLAKPIHTLTIGTTRSGKTTTFVDRRFRYYAEQRPSRA